MKLSGRKAELRARFVSKTNEEISQQAIARSRRIGIEPYLISPV